MKKIFIPLSVLASMGITQTVFAQDDVQKEKKEKKESEEVIIRNKGDKETKLTVVIDGDKISVNGKPLAEFKDDQVTINKRKIIIREGDDEDVIFTPGFEGAFNFNQDMIQNIQRNIQDCQQEETKAFLGVTTEKADDGVKVTAITKGSAAEKAGIKKDDIITKIDDNNIDDPQKLSEVIASMEPKTAVTVSYKRKGKKNTTKATLGERKEKRTFAYTFDTPLMPPIPPLPPEVEMYDDMAGVNGETPDGRFNLFLPRQKKLGLKIQDTEEGGNVRVIEVEDSSAAAKAGIQKDDLITEINGTKVNNTDEAREQLRPEEGKTSYKIKATRKGAEMNFDVRIPKKLKTADL